MYNDATINGPRQPLKLRWIILFYVILAITAGGLFTFLRYTHHKTVKLHWIETTAGVRYRIYRSEGITLSGDSKVFALDADPRWHEIGVSDSPDYEDKTAQPGQTYWYCTRAEDSSAKLSAPSNFVTVTIPR